MALAEDRCLIKLKENLHWKVRNGSNTHKRDRPTEGHTDRPAEKGKTNRGMCRQKVGRHMEAEMSGTTRGGKT